MKSGSLSASIRKRLAEAGHLRHGVLAAAHGPILKPANKFNARRVCLDGHVFQSQLEADYYLFAKAIHGNKLEVHPSLTLVAGIRYKPDFAFPEKGRMVYVDTKSDATGGGRFPVIKKLWREFGPGVLRIVYRGPRGGFLVKQEIHSKDAHP